MNENESYSNFINFTYKSKENKDYVKIISDFCEMQKKIKYQMLNLCSEFCLGNLKSEFLSENENHCYIDCFNKYLDTISLAEKISENYSLGKLNKSLLIKGNFEQFIKEAKNNI